MASKPIPKFDTDEELEQFLEQDLTDYLDPDNFTPATGNFEHLQKTAQINLRVPEPLVEAIKAKAAQIGIPYQRYIRHLMQKAVESK